MPAVSSILTGIGLAIGAAGTAYQMSQGAPKTPAIPKAEVPAVAAPGYRTDTGASVSIGTGAEDIKNQRVSGRSRKSSSSSGGDVLGGLGRSGLSI